MIERDLIIPEDFCRISINTLPVVAIEHFLERARLLGDRDANEITDFDTLLKLDFSTQHSAYFARHTRVTPTSANTTGSDSLVYVADALNDTVVAGHGEFSLSLDNTSSYHFEKPCVMDIETKDGYQRRGYGHKRYLAMNAASNLIFGFPLHSREVGNFLSDEAIRRWEKLVEEGLAESFWGASLYPNRPSVLRYRFKN